MKKASPLIRRGLTRTARLASTQHGLGEGGARLVGEFAPLPAHSFRRPGATYGQAVRSVSNRNPSLRFESRVRSTPMWQTARILARLTVR